MSTGSPQRFDVLYTGAGGVTRRIRDLSKTQARDQLLELDLSGIEATALEAETGAPIPRCTCGYQGGCYVTKPTSNGSRAPRGRAYTTLLHALDGTCGLCDDPHLTRGF